MSLSIQERLKDLRVERGLTLERDIDKLTDSILDVPKSAWAGIGQKIETATMQKNDLEIDLSKLRIANKIRYTESDIVVWLKSFCKGDLFDMEFRRRIIDTFINSVYLYDDRVIVFYNIRGGKQVSYIDMLDATEGFPGLDDEPAPGDSGESPDAKEKPDTTSGVRLLNASHQPCNLPLQLFNSGIVKFPVIFSNNRRRDFLYTGDRKSVV